MSENKAPYGYCQCGCGQKTTIPSKSNKSRNHIKGQPIQYKSGHNNRTNTWASPEVCACGCGQAIKRAKGPSRQPRFINGHGRRQPISSRFWAKVDKRGQDDCWNWTAATGKHGYGEMGVDGHTTLAHRISWELANGPIPDRLHVLHHCDNRLCCNVAHLFLGTNLDNVNDMVKKGRQAKSKDKPNICGENNKSSVLTAAQVVEIRNRCENGEIQRKISQDYGVSPSSIFNIYRRVTWKHI